MASEALICMWCLGTTRTGRRPSPVIVTSPCPSTCLPAMTATWASAHLGCTEAEVSDEVVWQQHRTVFEALPQQWPLLRRVRALDLAVYMPGLGLAYIDRAAMHHGAEVRVPWLDLDLDLVRWALRLPDDALVRGRNGKWLPRQIAQQVLPELISTRPKRGFGIPTSMIRRDGTSAGSRGFRQGTYFSHVEEQLRQYMAG